MEPAKKSVNEWPEDRTKLGKIDFLESKCKSTSKIYWSNQLLIDQIKSELRIHKWRDHYYPWKEQFLWNKDVTKLFSVYILFIK